MIADVDDRGSVLRAELVVQKLCPLPASRVFADVAPYLLAYCNGDSSTWQKTLFVRLARSPEPKREPRDAEPSSHHNV